MNDITQICVQESCTVREAIAGIDKNGKGIVLVVDAERRLLGTITDGDIRRAILAGAKLDSSVQDIIQRKKTAEHAKPVSVSVHTPHTVLLQMMHEKMIHQIPLLDEEDRVVDLVTLDELLPDQILPLQAVIMAGGKGTRLHPLTEDMPKPMLPVGDRPLMEHLVEQFRRAGIKKVNITTHYRSEKITEHFGDGRDFGVEINYVAEQQPLGTVGALGLMEKTEEPFLVVNGDVLTRIDFRTMLRYHREHKADLTVALRKYDMHVPYGVAVCDDMIVKEIVEKPNYQLLVNAGIYLLEPSVVKYVPVDQYFDMTDLIKILLAKGQRVVGFPVLEYWLDIGQLGDYEQAQRDIKKLGNEP